MDLTAVVDHVRQGNKEEFRHIIRECNQPLYRTAIVILKNESDAEDAIQTAYLKAYQHLQSFRGESSFLTWITRILINECKMILRKKKGTTSLDHQEVMQKPSINENALDSLNKKQLNQLLERAVLDLPEKYRLVYVVREVNEFSTEKAAAMLGLTEENVKVRLHRAKSIIRESLLQQVNVQELFPYGNLRCELMAERIMRAIIGMQTGVHNSNDSNPN
jgi:RNA polymerase sigma factor (sigma-70 family)